MLHKNEIKINFKKCFREVLDNETTLKHLLYDIFVFGSAYIVGGYLRDIISKKKPRDLDILVDLEYTQLLEIIISSKIKYETNRHNGIKLLFDTIEVDMWSIDNNWAFKNKLVKLNEKDKLKSIAKGCFYNYDALVINLHNYNFNIQYYKEFIDKSCLNILQKSSKYKNLNPTIEANILRAFYLKKMLNISYSTNTKNYLISKIGYLKDKEKDIFEILVFTKSKYPKYDNFLSSDDILKYLNELIDEEKTNNQFRLDI